MTGWIVLFVILALIILLLLTRVGGVVIYGKDDISVGLRVGFLKFQAFPRKEKKRKAEREKAEEKRKRKKPKKAKEKEPEEEQGGKLDLFREVLPLTTDVFGQLKRKMRIDLLHIRIIWGGEDPAVVAMGYGTVNAVVGMIWPILDNNFNIRARNIETGVDFEQKAPTIYMRASFSLRIGSGIALCILVIRKGLPAYRLWRGMKTAAENTKVEVTK